MEHKGGQVMVVLPYNEWRQKDRVKCAGNTHERKATPRPQEKETK